MIWPCKHDSNSRRASQVVATCPLNAGYKGIWLGIAVDLINVMASSQVIILRVKRVNKQCAYARLIVLVSALVLYKVDFMLSYVQVDNEEMEREQEIVRVARKGWRAKKGGKRRREKEVKR